MASSTTEYVVLRRNVDGSCRELDDSYIATGAAKARRMAAEATGEDGEYAAVPVRSIQWEPFRFENVRALVRGQGTTPPGNNSSAAPAPSGTLVGSTSGSASA